ncbi:MAG: hypothetical protein ABJG47_16360 [Ekhidna sp.]
MSKIQYIIISLLLFLSCDEPITNNNFIDEELRPYIESFIEEANRRGVQLNIDDFGAEIVNEISIGGDNTYCGYGWFFYRGTLKKRIEVKNSDNCWQSRTDIERENLVFHELGHALLGRPHLDETFPNESPKSIMCSSDGPNGCNNFNTYHDNELFRSYYLDELFDRGTKAPDFINKDNLVRTVFQEGGGEYYSNWELFIIEDEMNDSEFAFAKDNSDHSVTLTTNGSPSDDMRAIIVKRFELENFNQCDNLKSFMDITAEGITDGFFRVSLSLRERLSDGSLSRIYLNSRRESENGTYNNFVHELYCLSEKTEIVSISFALHSKTPASINIENLNIDLFE